MTRGAPQTPFWCVAEFLLLAAMIVGGCGVTATPNVSPTAARPSPSPTPSVHAITGTFTLVTGFNSYVLIKGGACIGTGGYSDISAELQVVVTNETGATIGLGHLTDNIRATQVANKTSRDLGIYDQGDVCVYDFTVSGVPEAAFYRVGVGKRGVTQYGRSDLEASGWKVGLTLGP